MPRKLLREYTYLSSLKLTDSRFIHLAGAYLITLALHGRLPSKMVRT